jgi:hypothetical protein
LEKVIFGGNLLLFNFHYVDIFPPMYRGQIRWASYAFISVCSYNTSAINYCKLKLDCHHCHFIKFIQLVGILLIRDNMTLSSLFQLEWRAIIKKTSIYEFFWVTFFHGFIFYVFNLSFENIFNNTSVDSNICINSNHVSFDINLFCKWESKLLFK